MDSQLLESIVAFDSPASSGRQADKNRAGSDISQPVRNLRVLFQENSFPAGKTGLPVPRVPRSRLNLYTSSPLRPCRSSWD